MLENRTGYPARYLNNKLSNLSATNLSQYFPEYQIHIEHISTAKVPSAITCGRTKAKRLCP